MAADSRHPAGELYVHRINELREEIGQAMAAIASNKLGALEESLWRQEILCTGLKHLLCAAQQPLPGTARAAALHASLSALHEVNRSYAELVRQAQASNHLLYALCSAHAADSHPLNTPQRCSLEA